LLVFETGCISKDLLFVTYFRQVMGFSVVNDAIKKLEIEIQSLVEAGELFLTCLVIKNCYIISL
jgi:hypothetical protein